MAVNWGTVAPALIGAGAAGTSAYLAYRGNKRAIESAEEQAALEREDQRGSNLLDVASRESLANPFRDQVNQAGSLAMLDRIANARRGTTSINVPPEMQRFMPARTGGFSYEASPDLREAAKRLQQDIASGRGAPTMTNPANYGMHGGVNLNDPTSTGRPPVAAAPPATGTGPGAVPRNGGTVPPTVAPPSGSSRPSGSSLLAGTGLGDDDNQFDDADDFYSSVIPEYERRGKKDGSRWDTAGSAAITGSAMAGPYAPVVAGIGALMKAFGRTAQTAPSDFDLASASDIYKRAGEEAFDPLHEREEEEITPEELDAALRSQGWEPGDRWVGEKGLFQIVNALFASDEARQRKQRQQQAEAELAPSYAGLFA